MKIKEMIEEKREWKAHMDRVKSLPKDYQIVYKEMQKYIFKVGTVDPKEGTNLLSGIVDFFEEGVSLGKEVLEVTGSDVAIFCDDLMKDLKTYAEMSQEYADQEVYKAVKKSIRKMK